MVDGSSRKRKLDVDGVGTSSRVDAADAFEAWELASAGADGSASHPAIFTNSGLIVHPVPSQPRIHARPLAPVQTGQGPSRNVSQILPVPPQFPLLSYHPPTLLSASLDATSRYLVAFYPLSIGGPLMSRKERLLTQGSLSGCLVLYTNDSTHAEFPTKPRYRILQFWDLQSDAVDVLWLNQPRQWAAFDDTLRCAAGPQAVPGAGNASFAVLTAQGMAQLYVPQRISARSATPSTQSMHCLQCPVMSTSAATLLQSMMAVPAVADQLIRRSAMARSPVDGKLYVAFDLQEIVAISTESSTFASWDWASDGFVAPRRNQPRAVHLARLHIDLFAPSGPTLTCTPLPPLDISHASKASPRPDETSIQHLAFRQTPRGVAEEAEEDDPLFASSPEDVKEKLPGTSSGLQLVVSTVTRSNEPQSSRTAGYFTHLEAWDLVKIENPLLEGFVALTEPPKVDRGPASEQITYRRCMSKQMPSGSDIRSLRANPTDLGKLLVLVSELRDGKSSLYFHNLEYTADLSHGVLVQQSSDISFLPSDRVSEISVSHGLMRGGFGVLAASAPSTQRAELLIGGGGASVDADDLVRRTSKAVACAVLQGTSADDALIAAASLARLISAVDGLAERIIEGTWQALKSVLPETSGAVAMTLAEDMLKVQHRCYRVFGNARAAIGADTLTVVRANRELEKYLDGSDKNVAPLAAVLPDALKVIGSVQRRVVMANGKLEWFGQLDPDADETLAIALNLAALSALQGLAGNLAQVIQEMSSDAPTPSTPVQTLEGLLRLQSQTSVVKHSLSMSGIDFDKLEVALGELATDPKLAPPPDVAAILFTARPMDTEAAMHKLISSLAGCSSAALLIGSF